MHGETRFDHQVTLNLNRIHSPPTGILNIVLKRQTPSGELCGDLCQKVKINTTSRVQAVRGEVFLKVLELSLPCIIRLGDHILLYINLAAMEEDLILCENQ